MKRRVIIVMKKVVASVLLLASMSAWAQPPQVYDMAKAIQQPDVAGSFQRGVQQGQQQRLNQQAIQANQQQLQQQQNAEVDAEQLKLIARALIHSKPAERPELLAQMASIDPQMALQYQQMLTQMDAQQAASAPNNSQ